MQGSESYWCEKHKLTNFGLVREWNHSYMQINTRQILNSLRSFYFCLHFYNNNIYIFWWRIAGREKDGFLLVVLNVYQVLQISIFLLVFQADDFLEKSIMLWSSRPIYGFWWSFPFEALLLIDEVPLEKGCVLSVVV